MCVCVLDVHMHVGASGGQKRASDPAELELQEIVSFQMSVLGIKLWSMEKQQFLVTTEPSHCP